MLGLCVVSVAVALSSVSAVVVSMVCWRAGKGTDGVSPTAMERGSRVLAAARFLLLWGRSGG